jgi:uncharacterized protein YjbI with pentapeptide repeats
MLPDSQSPPTAGPLARPTMTDQPIAKLLSHPAIAIFAVSLMILGWILPSRWLAIPATLLVLGLCLRVLWLPFSHWIRHWLSAQQQLMILALITAIVAGVSLLTWIGGAQTGDRPGVNWDAVGALAEAFGAIGQISVALLAAYVSWRQYVISKELTTQQNRITQQQTIDGYFQGISDLILDEEGLLEDWPPERAIAEGRTAAILSGVDGEGKAKIIRFLSSSKLLSPLKRDRRLGRAIFDGLGGYEEDVEFGVRVIDLAAMLAGADLSGNDLRSTELSEANLVGANLANCDLSRANLSRTILHGADLSGADLSLTRLFCGLAETATPRDRLNPPDYAIGTQTGAVIENADFSGVQGLSEDQRYYCCAWGGERTRSTIPGSCEGIPNKLQVPSPWPKA